MADKNKKKIVKYIIPIIGFILLVVGVFLLVNFNSSSKDDNEEVKKKLA